MSLCHDFCQWLCCCVEDIVEGDDDPGSVDDATLKITDDPTVQRQGKKKQLFNRHGFNLAIFQGGNVRGVRDGFHPNAVLEVWAVGVGEVQMRGVESGLLLAMDKNGRLYGTEDDKEDGTVFIEDTQGPYLVYLSKKYAHHGWHVGLKQNGDPKNGRLTWYPWGQKAIQFMSRRPYADLHPLKQLKNRHGFTLSIEPDGKVRGTLEEFSKYSIMEFSPSVSPGTFRIRGIETNLYLAMNDKGRLYGEPRRQEDDTLFAEHALGAFFLYLPVRWAHLGWYVGIKKSGKAKRAIKTSFPWPQKAIQFKHVIPYPPPTKIDFGEMEVPPLTYIDEDEDGLAKR